VKIKRIFLAGLANLVLGMLINWVVGLAWPQIAEEYMNAAIFRPWQDPLMTAYFGYPFILAAGLSYLWDKLKATDPFEFAKLYVVIATIPGMFITYTSFQISLAMIGLWSITGFLQAKVAGWVFARVKN